MGMMSPGKEPTMANEIIKVTLKVEDLNAILTSYGIKLVNNCICMDCTSNSVMVLNQTPSQNRKDIAILLSQTPSQNRKGIVTIVIRGNV